MIVNAFSVVAAFAAVLRAHAGRDDREAEERALGRAPREPGDGDDRLHLLLASCATLLVLAAASWPLLYLVLESYVPSNGGPDWPDVMCVEGVTRIGTGSEGAASWLPALLRVLAVTKPLLVFASGAWLVLHLLHRRGRTDALRRRVLAALALAGLLAVADGAAETAYLVIPKQERFLASGCCSTAPAVPEAPPQRGAGTTAAFLGVGLGAVLAVSLAIRRGGPWLAAAAVLAAASVPLGVAFLEGVAAPRLLHLPYHRCAFCLARRMPETLVGIALYLVGALGVGWALVARTGGGTGEGLLRAARFGYLGALVMAGVMLANA